MALELASWPAVVAALAAAAILAALLALLLPGSGKPAQKLAASSVKRAEQAAKPLKKYTVAEVAQHNKENDCWLIVDGKVYDVTAFVEIHPGGDAILNNAGADSSKGFHGPQHPSSTLDLIEEYLIGELQ
eukprot:jgi/Chlat1/4027/Chrsp26S03990